MKNFLLCLPLLAALTANCQTKPDSKAHYNVYFNGINPSDSLITRSQFQDVNELLIDGVAHTFRITNFDLVYMIDTDLITQVVVVPEGSAKTDITNQVAGIKRSLSNVSRIFIENVKCKDSKGVEHVLPPRKFRLVP